MCGICGELRLKQGPAEQDNIRTMLGPLRPRGPDDEGIFSAGQIALGHRRLAIIDLSAAAQQPMLSADQSLAIVDEFKLMHIEIAQAVLDPIGLHIVLCAR